MRVHSRPRGGGLAGGRSQSVRTGGGRRRCGSVCRTPRRPVEKGLSFGADGRSRWREVAQAKRGDALRRSSERRASSVVAVAVAWRAPWERDAEGAAGTGRNGVVLAGIKQRSATEILDAVCWQGCVSTRGSSSPEPVNPTAAPSRDGADRLPADPREPTRAYAGLDALGSAGVWLFFVDEFVACS